MLMKVKTTNCNKGLVVAARPLLLNEVQAIKAHLKNDPKWLSLFVVGVNSALRASDLLTLTTRQIIDNGLRITIYKIERKTRKTRRIVLGEDASKVLRRWLRIEQPEHFIWAGQRGPHTHAYVGQKLKEWCEACGIQTQHVATHSMRKAFARNAFEQGTRIEVLMDVLKHSSPGQTLQYICVTTEEVDALFRKGL